MAQKRRVAALIAAAAGIVVLFSPALAAAATATTTTGATSTGAKAATALYTSAITAAGKQTSVHYVAKSSESGKSLTITASSSATAGTQKIVLYTGKKASGHLSGRLVDKVAYFKGDTFGLEEYLGMPATLAPKYSGKWIYFSSATKSYAPIAASFGLSAAVGQISMKGPYKQGTSRVNGKAATTLTGANTASGKKGKPGSATLAVAAQGTPLPIRFLGKSLVSKKLVTDTVNYGRWGLKVSPKAPKGAVPASSITSSS